MRPRFPPLAAPVDRVRPRSAHRPVRDAAAMDRLLPPGRAPPRDPNRPAAMGLQAPGARLIADAAVAGDPVGQADRDARPGAPAGDLADVLQPRRPRLVARD